RRVALQNSANFESRHFWQHQIKNNEIRSVVASLLQTASAVGGRRSPEARLAQVQREQVCHVGFVFDDQDFSSRASLHLNSNSTRPRLKFQSFCTASRSRVGGSR